MSVAGPDGYRLIGLAQIELVGNELGHNIRASATGARTFARFPESCEPKSNWVNLKSSSFSASSDAILAALKPAPVHFPALNGHVVVLAPCNPCLRFLAPFPSLLSCTPTATSLVVTLACSAALVVLQIATQLVLCLLSIRSGSHFSDSFCRR